jgi:hypothetical protein
MAEMCEASDELEPLRPPSVWADGRRDGSSGAGVICFCCVFRDGSGGAAPRNGAGGGGAMPRFPLPMFKLTSSVLRRGRGGVAEVAASSVTARVGRGGMAGLFCAEDVVITDSVAVRTGGGGGGARLPAVDGGAWKFFCLLSAAIRSPSVGNCGSSTSAILRCYGSNHWLYNHAMASIGRGSEVLRC